EGVPFFVEELALPLRAEGLLRLTPPGRRDHVSDSDPLIPQSIRSVEGRRRARLPAVARDIIGLASVSGREFELAVLVDIADRRRMADVDAVEAALQEAVAGRLLLERGTTYVFAHEQIREVLYQSLSAVRRRQL